MPSVPGMRSKRLAKSVAWLLPTLLAVASVAAAGPPPIADEARLLYNARLALRDNQPSAVLKHWLLYNTFLEAEPSRTAARADLTSVVWTALGDLGICQDGLRRDSDGAGLWPLALHNWIVRNMGNSAHAEPESPFGAFEVSLQQRFISLQDVLTADELRSAVFRRTACLLPVKMMLQLDPNPWADWRERRRAAELLRALLRRAQTTLSSTKVRGFAAVQTRLFDINLYLTQLAALTARSQARSDAEQAKEKGVPAPAVHERQASAADFAFDDASEQAAILRASLTWPASEWVLLAPERRLFLFPQARKLAQTSVDPLILSIVDALIERHAGADVEHWIAFFEAEPDLARRVPLWSGARGEKLLSLDVAAGFHERGTIALHRGVGFLQENNLAEALRSFAYALHHAADSRDADAVAGLARRWLAFVIGQHTTTQQITRMLAALLPPRELELIVEDLTWRAALRADAASFALLTHDRNDRGGFAKRVAYLTPLAQGSISAFEKGIIARRVDDPRATMHFLQLLVGRLEAEEQRVRALHRGTLTWLAQTFATAAEEPQGGKTQRLLAQSLRNRCATILAGLSPEASADLGATGHRLSASNEVSAGSVRLAPNDALPWPFRAPPPSRRSMFTPLRLWPVEWPDADGALVMGWEISE